ncbi:hypothetical protein IWX90DRAFT_485921 [Phyllosticta citrichinensis]|uniref:Uncharacterized protein n=1 Tax=Phyllosticta citrichinensis TaxID=1130410 RepID=A0ABR1XXI7_9PEZI
MRIRISDSNNGDLESGRVSPPRYSSLSVRSRETLPSPGDLDVEMGDLSRRPNDDSAATQSPEPTQQQQQQQQPQICADCGRVHAEDGSRPTATTTTAVASAATQTTTEPRQQQSATTTTTTPSCEHWTFSELARAAMTVTMGAWAFGAYIKMIHTKKADAQQVERLKHIMMTVNACIAIVCIGVEKLLRPAKKSGLSLVVYFWTVLCVMIFIGGLVPWWDPKDK